MTTSSIHMMSKFFSVTCKVFKFPVFFFFLNRSILAALHFNYNVNRETKRDKDGQPLLHVSYTKFKDGEATVREARVSANYGNVLNNNLLVCSLHLQV